jgi:hypothetical protein
MNRARAWWIGTFAVPALIGLSTAWLPAPLPMDAPASSFSAARAFADIKAIANAPHPTGSNENARVCEYLLKRMGELGLNPREMKGVVEGVAVVNLYGELEGVKKGNPPILLMAHYDSVPRGPGAADDSTGVAVALETIRALRANGTPPNSVAVLLTDGEEVHGVCRGANLFVHAETNLMSALKVVVNLEARGNRGPVLMFQTGSDNNELINLFAQACPLPVTASFSEDVYRRMPNDTDLTEFLKNGKRGFNFAFTGGIEFYHSPEDTPENLNQFTLQHYGACVLPLVAKLAQASGQEMDGFEQRGDATFFPIWRGALIHYPAWLERIFVIITGLLFCVALALGARRYGLRIGWTLASAGVTLLAVLISTGAGVAVVFAVKQAFRPRVSGPFLVGVPNSGAIVVGLLIVAAVLTMVLRTWLLRRVTHAEALAGALILWVGLTLAVNGLLPGASYLFLWPSIFGIVALVSSFRRGNGALQTLCTAIPAALLLPITLLLVHQTITIGSVPLSAALIGLAACLEPVGKQCQAVA